MMMQMRIFCGSCGAEAPNPDAPTSRAPGFRWQCPCGKAEIHAVNSRISMAGVAMRTGDNDRLGRPDREGQRDG